MLAGFYPPQFDFNFKWHNLTSQGFDVKIDMVWMTGRRQILENA